MLMDEAGLAIRTVEAAYSTRSPEPGWSEQDPQLWIDALDTAIEELRTTEPRFSNLHLRLWWQASRLCRNSGAKHWQGLAPTEPGHHR